MSGLGRKLLLGCGIASSLLWPVSSEVLAARLYRGYSPLSQAVSELTSFGAPTRGPLIIEGLVRDALLAAFGLGVRTCAHGDRDLRLAGDLLVAYAATGPLWLPFPATARGGTRGRWAVRDTAHLSLTTADVLLALGAMRHAGTALGGAFRVYSLATMVSMVVSGAATGGYVPLVTAGRPTPGMGAAERVMIGAGLLWVVVLAVALLEDGSEQTTAPGRRTESRRDSRARSRLRRVSGRWPGARSDDRSGS